MLTRTLKLGCVGLDVEGWARGAHRYLATGQLGAFSEQKPIVRRTFGIGKRTLAKKCAAKAGLPQYGVVGPALYSAMKRAGAFDAEARMLFAEYQASLEPVKPPNVEPAQGFSSLHHSLWALYSEGRRLGLTDLGTYNPASVLPSGSKSDHAVYPAMAFDLGFTPHIGYEHPTARRFFDLCVGRPEVEYAILGDRIWSRAQGLRRYSAGNHANHVHVSGNR